MGYFLFTIVFSFLFTSFKIEEPVQLDLSYLAIYLSSLSKANKMATAIAQIVLWPLNGGKAAGVERMDKLYMLIDFHAVNITPDNACASMSPDLEESSSILTSRIQLPNLPLVQEIKSQKIHIERRIILTLFQLRGNYVYL